MNVIYKRPSWPLKLKILLGVLGYLAGMFLCGPVFGQETGPRPAEGPGISGPSLETPILEEGDTGGIEELVIEAEGEYESR